MADHLHMVTPVGHCLVLIGHHLQIHCSLNETRFKHTTSHRGMLTVIVGCVKECMHPFAAFETVLVGTVGQKLLDSPAYSLDIDFGILADFPLSTERGVGRRCDYTAVLNGCNRVCARFEMAGEELIECLPSSVRLNIGIHIVGRRVIVRLHGLGGKRFGSIHLPSS